MIEFTRRRGDIAIEATCHAPDWEGCYDQIRRILKPGGTVRLPSHFAHCALFKNSDLLSHLIFASLECMNGV